MMPAAPRPTVPVTPTRPAGLCRVARHARRGLPEERARIQAEMLLESDLMGHTTHGLNLLPVLLAELASGGNEGKWRAGGAGRPSGGAALGRPVPAGYLAYGAGHRSRPGQAREQPGRDCRDPASASHCRAWSPICGWPPRRALAILIVNSDPSSKTVAAHGGIERQITPNPLAFGYPTERRARC